jgi:hypothetical protein
MSFDYIDILGVTKKEEVAVPTISAVSSTMQAYSVASSIYVTFETDATSVSFDVVDMNGHTVAKAIASGESGMVTFNQSLRAGVYAVKMTAGNDVVVQQVIVK